MAAGTGSGRTRGVDRRNTAATTATAASTAPTMKARFMSAASPVPPYTATMTVIPNPDPSCHAIRWEAAATPRSFSSTAFATDTDMIGSVPPLPIPCNARPISTTAIACPSVPRPRTTIAPATRLVPTMPTGRSPIRLPRCPAIGEHALNTAVRASSSSDTAHRA